LFLLGTERVSFGYLIQKQNTKGDKMKKLLFLILTASLFFTACSNEDSVVTSDTQPSTEQDAIAKIAEEDEVIQSFEPNYNEEQVMSFFGKVAEAIYPLRIGQRMLLKDRNFDVTVDGDSALVSILDTFEGTLFIAASYDEFSPGDTNIVDTLLQKTFTSQVSRKVKLLKVANTENPRLNWRVKSVSLPEGGTLADGVPSTNIQINKMTITYQNGDVMEITNPNEYFLSRMPGFHHQIPMFGRGEEITVNIELQSAYADTDFVSLTWGALRGMPHHRAKRKFDMVSSEFDGTYYQKVYQQTFITHFVSGFRHAIINAMPKQVVLDDASAVEENSWGVPYGVH